MAIPYSMDGVPGPKQTPYVRFGKRLLDLLISAVVLLVFGPLMILIAILVKAGDGGPVLYRQERVGLHGRLFHLTKFRSMCLNAEHKGAGILVERNDARITTVGKVIRKLSLDELTQIFDVIRGEMSVVGPRPGLLYQAELYDDEQRRRLTVRPGITGWAQVNGRNALSWEDKFALDVWYVDHHSLALDMRILWATIHAVLRREGISAADHVSMHPFTGGRP